MKIIFGLVKVELEVMLFESIFFHVMLIDGPFHDRHSFMDD